MHSSSSQAYTLAQRMLNLTKNFNDSTCTRTSCFISYNIGQCGVGLNLQIRLSGSLMSEYGFNVRRTTQVRLWPYYNITLSLSISESSCGSLTFYAEYDLYCATCLTSVILLGFLEFTSFTTNQFLWHAKRVRTYTTLNGTIKAYKVYTCCQRLRM